MTPIEKARAALKQEQSRREEFYEGAAYALGLAEVEQVCESEKPKTNGDMVRAMSDEELYKLFSHCFISCGSVCTENEELCIENGGCCNGKTCHGSILAWIRREAERWHLRSAVCLTAQEQCRLPQSNAE